MSKVIDVGPWRGPTLEEWLERITAAHSEDGIPSLRKGETLPLIKRMPEYDDGPDDETPQ